MKTGSGGSRRDQWVTLVGGPRAGLRLPDWQEVDRWCVPAQLEGEYVNCIYVRAPGTSFAFQGITYPST